MWDNIICSLNFICIVWAVSLGHTGEAIGWFGAFWYHLLYWIEKTNFTGEDDE